MVRNHVMITLTLFGSGETALDHGSRFESDGGRAAISRSAPGQSVSVKPRQRGSIAGGLVPRTDQKFLIFSLQLVQGGAKKFLAQPTLDRRGTEIGVWVKGLRRFPLLKPMTDD